MIHLRSTTEIDIIARGGAIVAAVLQAVGDAVRPGVSTKALDILAEDLIRSHDGALPAFKGLYGFPATLCTSVNEQVVHGIPDAGSLLSEGDIVSVDVGVELDGWFSDAAYTFSVGEVDAVTAKLLEVTQEALEAAIEAARPGNRMGDIGHAVERTVAGTGFGIVRDLVGHGVGRKPHEEPQVPNLGQPGQGIPLREGLVLAIEPMINAGTHRVKTLADRWTVVTTDGKRSAHFEHTVAITAEGPRVLTATADRTATPV